MFKEKGILLATALLAVGLLAGCSQININGSGLGNSGIGINLPGGGIPSAAVVGAILPSTDWCKAGTAWAAPNISANGVPVIGQAKISGMTTFKGGTFCHATASFQAGTTNISTDYYFSKRAKEVWVELNVDGQRQEYHMSY